MTPANALLGALRALSFMIDIMGLIAMSKKIGIWGISIPKERVITLINAMDADQDGFITGGEIRAMLKNYLTNVKKSNRFVKK